ncbi:hypothetical protein LJ737_20645 [Hymenobacter sp. 15J16-1T3B]|uniref:hypothetical protein n=1 Tax=Hymenobacter sp. 15J16-1T3B TaxID=2886941 RepID=UPI001D119A77|nr:hypothetical protein [Hymenobacter sp. 15J16-1T3B]MCC3159662.1 hypothetical protein [Hymenobacter sp. 15J16-1T3B]
MSNLSNEARAAVYALLGIALLAALYTAYDHFIGQGADWYEVAFIAGALVLAGIVYSVSRKPNLNKRG